MKVSRKAQVVRFMVGQAIMILIGCGLAAGSFVFLTDKKDYLAGGSLAIVALALLYLSIAETVAVLFGKVVVRETVVLPLPGTTECELVVPNNLRKPRVIVFFEDTHERYNGTITASLAQTDQPRTASVQLPRIQPSRFRVPGWLPTSDAGTTLETWPRRTGQSAALVVIKMPFHILAGEKLKVKFTLIANFEGTSLQKRFPVAGHETIHIWVKE